MRRSALCLALLGLAACDGGGDPVEQALRETATANQSAIVKETATVEPARTPDEMRAAALIAENRAAIASARAALPGIQDPELQRLAQTSIEARTREIAALQAWSPAAPATE